MRELNILKLYMVVGRIHSLVTDDIALSNTDTGSNHAKPFLTKTNKKALLQK